MDDKICCLCSSPIISGQMFVNMGNGWQHGLKRGCDNAANNHAIAALQQRVAALEDMLKPVEVVAVDWSIQVKEANDG